MLVYYAPKAKVWQDLGTSIQRVAVKDSHCYQTYTLVYLDLLPGRGGLDSNVQGSPRFNKLSVLLFLKITLAETPTEETGVPQNKAHYTEFSTNSSQNYGITHLKDDAIVEEVMAVDDKKTEFQKLISRSKPTSDQSISTFFQRPIIITSGNLTTGDLVPTPLFSFTMPNQGMTNVMWAKKMDGLYAMRFTMVFKLQVNATRFQQGRYMMCWVPFGGCRGVTTTNTAVWDQIHRTSRQNRTQLPHVELDIGTQTSAILKVPYSSLLHAFPMSSLTDPNQLGALGRLYLYPYSPLVAASGLTAAGYTLLMSLEDVETYGASVPQMAPIRGKTSSETEAIAEGVGPISGVLSKVSKASGILSQIPLLSSYTEPVSWVTNILAGAAQVFGWSKPINLEHVTRINRNAVAYPSNFNAIDNSMPLSAMADNAVGVLDGFSGTASDEMSILSIARRPAFIGEFDWVVEKDPGDSILVLEVAPFGNYNTSVQNGNTILHATPLQYVASQFRYWRGSIQYTFKIVKTEFHTGRIMVAFTPEFFRTTVASTNYANTTYLHKEIIDLRTCNTFTITVPYMAVNPYKFTFNQTNQDFKTGGLYIYVVDRLVAPDTVSQGVKFLMEHSAGPDFEVAWPDPMYELTPLTDVTPQSGLIKRNDVPPNETLIVNIGSSEVDSPSLDYSNSCIGERVMSFRQMLKKHRFIGPPRGSPTTNAQHFTILPFAWRPLSATFVNINVDDYTPVDLYAQMSSIFLYSRGGVLLKSMNNPERDTTTANTNRVVVELQMSQFNTFNYLQVVNEDIPTTVYKGCGETSLLHESNPIEEQYAELSVPQYNMFHARLSSEEMCPRFFTSGSLMTPLEVHVYRETRDAEPDFGQPYVTRASKDDGNFGYFVSIPPMLIRNRFVIT